MVHTLNVTFWFIKTTSNIPVGSVNIYFSVHVNDALKWKHWHVYNKNGRIKSETDTSLSTREHWQVYFSNEYILINTQLLFQKLVEGLFVYFSSNNASSIRSHWQHLKSGSYSSVMPTTYPKCTWFCTMAEPGRWPSLKCIMQKDLKLATRAKSDPKNKPAFALVSYLSCPTQWSSFSVSHSSEANFLLFLQSNLIHKTLVLVK